MPELYDVLRPVFTRFGPPLPGSTPEEPLYWHRVHWIVVGTATSMEDAKRRFGGSPVLRPATH